MILLENITLYIYFLYLQKVAINYEIAEEVILFKNEVRNTAYFIVIINSSIILAMWFYAKKEILKYAVLLNSNNCNKKS